MQPQKSRLLSRQRSGKSEVCDFVFLGCLILAGISIVGTFSFVFLQAARARPPLVLPSDEPVAGKGDVLKVEDISAHIVHLTEELASLEGAIHDTVAKHEQYYHDRAIELSLLNPLNLSGRVRPDLRCGPNFVAPDGSAYGECDPNLDSDPGGPCCRPDSGWCGNVRHKSWGHCDCKDCVDFVKVREVREAIARKLAQT